MLGTTPRTLRQWDATGELVQARKTKGGRSTRQAEAVIGDTVASVVQYAREVGKPIVIERLDFRQKKSALEGESRRYSRMLSSFSYGKVKPTSCPAATGREWRYIRSTRPTVPSLAG